MLNKKFYIIVIEGVSDHTILDAPRTNTFKALNFKNLKFPLKNELDKNIFTKLIDTTSNNFDSSYFETQKLFESYITRVLNLMDGDDNYSLLYLNNSDYIFNSLGSSNGSYYSICRMLYYK